MYQAHADARVAEAAAEQRIAAALALERAELVKQARSFLCMCSDRLHCLSLVLQQMCAADCERDGCICSACGSMGHGVMKLSWRQALVFIYRCLCSADRALPSGQVQQARVEARNEAEAAAELRLAALDQARREEREAVVRMALALGAGRVRAPPGTPLGVHFTTHSVTDMPPSRHRAHPHIALAQGPRFAIWRRSWPPCLVQPDYVHLRSTQCACVRRMPQAADKGTACHRHPWFTGLPCHS